MLFSRIIYSAILVGVIAGMIMTGLQVLMVDPIIFAAESYEIAESASTTDTASHDHGGEEWVPEDGGERTFYTLLANISASIGFAAVLLALMSQFWLAKREDIKIWQAVCWGLAGFIAFYLAPGIGLPPEIPGVNAPPLFSRQAWWILTVLSVSIGLGAFAFAQVKLKAVGVLFLAIPYLIGAPNIDGPEFSHPDSAAVIELTRLHHEFIINSGVINLVFWLVLGFACTFAFNRWLRTIDANREYANT